MIVAGEFFGLVFQAIGTDTADQLVIGMLDGEGEHASAFVAGVGDVFWKIRERGFAG